MYSQLTKLLSNLLSNVVTYPEYIAKKSVVFEHVKEIAISNGGKVKLKVDGVFVELSFEVHTPIF